MSNLHSLPLFQTFESVDLMVSITEQYFPVVLSIMQYHGIQTLSLAMKSKIVVIQAEATFFCRQVKLPVCKWFNVFSS